MSFSFSPVLLCTFAQSAVLGFGVFRVLERYGITSGLSVAENVILQTTSVATATMPLAAGDAAPPNTHTCVHAPSCVSLHMYCVVGGLEHAPLGQEHQPSSSA